MAVCCDIRNARHVLVADDDENDVFPLRRAFRKAGLPHSLTHLRDGQQTIDYLITKDADSANQSKPDLLLLDLKMPLVDGFDVLVWLQGRSQTVSLPVVVLSSSSLVADKNRAKQLGAQDYLVKPTRMEELTALAQALHERWLKAAEC